MATQITCPPATYKPEFNPNNGKYFDVCPYEAGQRKRQPYRCPCNGYVFESRGKFFSHIDSKCHKNYIENYDFNTKEVEDLKTEKNILLAEKTNTENKLAKKTIELGKAVKYIKHLQEENKKQKAILENFDNINSQKQEEIETLNRTLEDKNKTIKRLEHTIDEINSYEFSEEDFHDCLNE